MTGYPHLAVFEPIQKVKKGDEGKCVAAASVAGDDAGAGITAERQKMARIRYCKYASAALPYNGRSDT
jgi:hypothetical protein